MSKQLKQPDSQADEEITWLKPTPEDRELIKRMDKRLHEIINEPTGDSQAGDVTAARRHLSKYFFGGNRELVIQRDGEKCVICGINRQEHFEKYRKDIAVDHIDKRGFGVPIHLKNNDMSNLQTLCISCNSRKDAPKAKLSAVQVINIRHCMNSGIAGYKLAELYGVNNSTIYRIWRGEMWPL